MVTGMVTEEMAGMVVILVAVEVAHEVVMAVEMGVVMVESLN